MCVVPLLFIIFIQGLIDHLKEASKYIRGDILGDSCLFFADDIVILAKSRGALQKLLDIVKSYSQNWRFTFNIDKCRVMVFSQKKKDQSQECFCLGSEKLGFATSYK